jgi:hypothetical protein
MNNLIYIVGVVVVILAVAAFFGFSLTGLRKPPAHATPEPDLFDNALTSKVRELHRDPAAELGSH